ncbi:uncharacterized protein LOC112572211 [Pomacea canaliculata]|uniref:uncharacterized protein LOC112572211 n=1 Tax=Pomacea canaliculata TaxID=400727 RepID=UPI000D73F773|nr:uncharacterized protein LOC112572211 [Pomacea canaliculata]
MSFDKQAQVHGGPVAQPSEFEAKYRPAFICHLPPLSASLPAFSERPRIVEQASYTKAAPVKEKKYFRRVSDSIGNNYSPGANKFTTSLIYNTTRGAYTVEESYFLSPRKPPRPRSPVLIQIHPDKRRRYSLESVDPHLCILGEAAKPAKPNNRDSLNATPVLPPITNGHAARAEEQNGVTIDTIHGKDPEDVAEDEDELGKNEEDEG